MCTHQPKLYKEQQKLERSSSQNDKRFVQFFLFLFFSDIIDNRSKFCCILISISHWEIRTLDKNGIHANIFDLWDQHCRSVSWYIYIKKENNYSLYVVNVCVCVTMCRIVKLIMRIYIYAYNYIILSLGISKESVFRSFKSNGQHSTIQANGYTILSSSSLNVFLRVCVCVFVSGDTLQKLMSIDKKF